MSNECTVCFKDLAIRDGLCQDCLDWEEYWNSLTPKQQRVEIQRMARYTEEAEQRGFGMDTTE
jgi:hypothetical protein